MVSWARQPSAAHLRRARRRAGLSIHGIDANRLLPIDSASVRLNACRNRSLTASTRWGGCAAARAQHEDSWARETRVTHAEKASFRQQQAVPWNLHGLQDTTINLDLPFLSYKTTWN